ncbi:ABC transporter permease [Spirochaeta dissipatitropha]
MSVLLRIALRNLKEHKAKTVIVGFLIALGVFLLIVGNSLLATAARGTELVFIDNFTGHVMVRAQSDNPVSIAGATGFTMEDLSGPRLPHYRDIYSHLQNYSGIKSMNPQVPFFARMDFSTEGQNQFALIPLFGIEPTSYLRMFPDSVKLTAGRFLEENEQGIVLHRKIRDELIEVLGIEVNPGDSVRLQSMSAGSGVRIREVKVKGIYEFMVEAPAMDGMSFMDVFTVRDLANMTIGTSDVVAIDEYDMRLLDVEDDFDSLFSDSLFFSVEEQVNDISSRAQIDPDSLFEGTPERSSSYSRIDSGAWSYILLMLEDGRATESFIDQLNHDFQENGWSVEAVGWGAASGGMATFVQAFQILFLIIVALITIVSIIIIMNTLVISVVERTAEIGTMRALGARKSMVRRMFVLETMSISIVFGMIGLFLGTVLLIVLGVIGLPAPNLFFEMLFGGSVLRPVFSYSSFFQAAFMMLGVGFLSSLYPVSVALRIQPVQAMQSN